MTLIITPGGLPTFYHLRTIWLFTFSDLKTIVFPSTIFAIINGVAAARLNTTESDTISVLARIPLILFWVWINLLPFNIDNQRQLDSIEEDALNKPWRPLPSHRLQPRSATKLMFACYATCFITSVCLGAHRQCIALMFFGWFYNDIHGADINPIVRNLVNGCGYVCFTSGALQVALKGESSVVDKTAWWISLIFLIVFTTIQSQDMYDQEGDAIRDRKTVPLVWGDLTARYTIAAPVAVWSLVCPYIWSCTVLGYVPVMILGGVVACRTMLKRSVDEDKSTFKLWNLWLTSIYCIPLMKSLSVA